MSGGGHAAKGSGHSKRTKRHEEEEHENHERWLVSYADMMTLLMVLFIVLFAISQVDQKKFTELKNGLAVGFGNPSVAFNGGESNLMESSDSDSPMDLSSGIGGTTSDATAIQDAVAAKERAQASQRQSAAQREVQNFEQIKHQITTELTRQGLQDQVRYSIDERGLVVTIVTTAVVFDGNQAQLLPTGQQIIAAVGPAIAALPNTIEVDGHTNQLTAGTGTYPSGWELSTARASTVVRHLHTDAGIPETRLQATGFADTKPLYPTTDPRAAGLNRRVEIIVMSNLPADTRALLPSAATD
ncbi:flagellar motor protein MotB [Dactylosporangium roseum]|uniref:Flagellar motor protein MotB n=1 Tax=Dactylosporangium roseum TaxID=47989 RepID=A0ABY5YZ73_9ACTN|nr:flagellar motor protein MotB [Dactylosporangium roseum]UWZ33539.1 flagellar motor protein MotB [Dactylosporangium roseum]UWZ35617.1 flagellar motor protein MotB [Dactylosporangium roseum]